MKLSPQARAAWRLLLLLLLFAGPAVLVACRDKAPTEATQLLASHRKNICWAPNGDCECWPPAVGTWPDDCHMPAGEPPPPVHQDSAKVWCTPHRITRGAAVACRVYIGRDARFDLTAIEGRSFSASSGSNEWRSFSVVPLEVPAWRDRPAGDTIRWNGPVVDTTIVRAEVAWIDSTSRRVSLPPTFDTIIVAARPVGEFEVTTEPIRHDSVFPRVMTDYPFHRVIGSARSMATYGVFRQSDSLWSPIADRLPEFVTKVDSGPNEGLFWFATIPALDERTDIFIHPALSGGLGNPLAARWYNDQRGGVATFDYDTVLARDRICNASGISELKRQVERHEGKGRNAQSHLGTLVSVMADARLRAFVEAVVVQRYPVLGKLAMQKKIESLKTANKAAQVRFDSTDVPLIVGDLTVPHSLGAIGCRILTHPGMALDSVPSNPPEE